MYGPQFPLPTRLQKDHRTNTNDLPGGKISGEIELVKSLQEGFKYDANKKSVFLEKWASRASCEQRRKKGGGNVRGTASYWLGNCRSGDSLVALATTG